MNTLKIKDMMLIGIYAALYFMCVGLGTLVGVVLIHSGNMMLAPVFTALFAGTVFMLLIAKVKKMGSIFLVGVVMALFFFMSGHYILSFVPSLLCGLLADGVAKIGKYSSKWWNLVAYTVFSFGNLGPILLMWVMRDAYIARLIEKGKDMVYIQNVMVDFNVNTALLLVGGVIVASLVGGLFGQYIVKKHFVKAGVVTL